MLAGSCISDEVFGRGKQNPCSPHPEDPRPLPGINEEGIVAPPYGSQAYVLVATSDLMSHSSRPQSTPGHSSL